MTQLDQWAARHNISQDALVELRTMLGAEKTNPPSQGGVTGSEAAASAAIRLEASQVGARLWRNNVGACQDQKGRHIRYGLCNESKQLNKRVKSSDLIGIKPVTITQDMVGGTLGQFVAREVKRPGWKYAATEREKAQLAFLNLVVSLGGDACFVTGIGSL